MKAPYMLTISLIVVSKTTLCAPAAAAEAVHSFETCLAMNTEEFRTTPMFPTRCEFNTIEEARSWTLASVL